jgi:peptidoglycan/xylan/chitin deacetylase (PgdA/CDA1 family)
MHSVLTYHTISAPAQPLPAEIDVAPLRFAAHLLWLARNRRVATLDEILATPARERFVAITFDDGFRDNLTVALPLLERFRLPCAVFVTTGFIGRPGYLSADELRRLSAHPLVTIGSHGVTHRHFTDLTALEAQHELTASREELEDLTGRRVDLLAWPYGSCNSALERLSASSGYRAAWTVWRGANRRHSLWRVPLGRRDNLPRFVAKISRAYFPLKRLVKGQIIGRGRPVCLPLPTA